MKLKINKKLEALVNYIDKEDRVADIGCDHAYLLIASVLEKHIQMGIGIDVKPGPLSAGRENIFKFGLEDRLDLRLGNGLEPLEVGEVSTVVIAGMGGYSIVEILEKNLSKLVSFDKLILQPMTEKGTVRRFLKKHGWTLVAETLVVADHIYVIMVAKKGEWLWNDDFLYEVGPFLYEEKGPLYEAYINYEIKTLEGILDGVSKGESNDFLLKRKADTLEKIKKWEAYKQ